MAAFALALLLFVICSAFLFILFAFVENIKYEELLAAWKILERKREKNRIANRKYKKTSKGKVAQIRAKKKYREKMKKSNITIKKRENLFQRELV